MRFLLPATLLISQFALCAPRVAWQNKLSGNGKDRVTAAATDRDGNFLLLGETTSRDFPATTLQKRPGGSSLMLDGMPVDIPLSGDVRRILTDRRNFNTTHVLLETGLMKTADSAQTWRVLYTGAIDDFAVNPTDSNTVYIAVSGNVLKTTDGGVTWNATATAAPSLVSTVFLYNFRISLAIDPSHPNTIYRNGLYRSDDGGASWQVLPDYIGNWIFDPLRPGAVFRFDFGFLEKSLDGGVTWAAIDPVSPAWSGTTNYFLTDPNRPGYLYAIKHLACVGSSAAAEPTLNRPGLYDSPCNDTRIYRSVNDGATWVQAPLFGYFFSVGAQPGLAAVYAHDGNHLIRTTDGFKTVTTVANMPRRHITGFGFTASGSILTGSNASTDLFVSKVDPNGKLIWSTYLGGDNYEIGQGIAAGRDGSVYVTGISYSTSFGITEDTGFRAAFVARISADGTKLLYSQPVAQGFTTPTSIAVDRTASAVIAGRAVDGFPATPGVVQPVLSINLVDGFPAIAQNAFALKVDGTGSTVYATFLGDAGMSASAVAIDDSGNAFVGGSALWKLSANGTGLLYSKFLTGKYFTSLLLDAQNGLYAGLNSATGNMLMKFAGDPPLPLYTKPLSEEGLLFSQSLAADSSGNAFLAGQTGGLSTATRNVLEGAGRDGGGFLAKISADGASLVYSSYLLSEVTAMTLGADGNPLVLTSPVVLTKFDESAPPLALALDGVLDAAGMTSTPLVAGSKIALTGVGLAALDTKILLNGVAVQQLLVDGGRLLFEVPPSVGPAALHVERSGYRSQDVKLTAAASSPAVFSSDGTGKGLAMAFNEDGSLNTPKWVSTPGSMMTLVVNGIDPQAELTVVIGGVSCQIVDTQRASIGGLPGKWDLVTIQLPVDIGGGHQMVQIYDTNSVYVRLPRVYIVIG